MSEKRLQNLPAFDREAFEKLAGDWKNAKGAPGSNRTVIEWTISTGARCFVYPASNRAAGKNLLATLGANDTDERYADWLEFDYVPEVVNAANNLELNPQVICTDLRPLQIQRARRRQLAANALTKVATGGSVSAK
ncbi:MAG: hypothetical protein H7Y38_07075 [Armatimonadetes bacterium]|nr:hypothetical protein [Armatimonadota bacterium]